MSLETRLVAGFQRVADECKSIRNAMTTALDTKAAKVAGVLGSGQPWNQQAMLNTGALANGYNDMAGGLMADRDVILESMVFWMENPTGAVTGTGPLTIQWYAGSLVAQETTLIHTSSIPVGQHDIWVVLTTPMSFPINSVFRAKVTLGSAAVAGSCHVQFRGRYQ